jgi:hypothetical protein
MHLPARSCGTFVMSLRKVQSLTKRSNSVEIMQASKGADVAGHGLFRAAPVAGRPKYIADGAGLYACGDGCCLPCRRAYCSAPMHESGK